VYKKRSDSRKLYDELPSRTDPFFTDLVGIYTIVEMNPDYED
jgi:hypothetical protein